ncbi:MAG: hypothetical protein ACRYFS_18125 [Janthinobacterium lividum]
MIQLSLFSLRPAFLCAAILAVSPLLGGCSGVVKNLNSAQINAPAIAVANPFGIDKKAAMVTVTNPNSAAITAKTVLKLIPKATNPNVNVFAFPNQNPISEADVKSAQLSFSLVPTVTLDQTGASVSSFTLQSFTVVGEVDDLNADGSINDSIVLSPLSTAGPITFTLQADGTYSATAGTFSLQQTASTEDANLQKLINIVTAEQPTNQAVLTLSATSSDLPNGTVMHITFNTTTLTIQTN